MEAIISKELLSEVLPYASINEELISYGLDKDNNLLLQYDDVDEIINIHELAHKCKEWCIDKGFIICTEMHYKNTTLCKLRRKNHYTNWIKPHFVQDTEPKAIFKACQWILDNK